MEVSSYDELLHQVESLKAENCNLRKELADNSNHLSKLENEASTMKEVLSHLQVTMDGRPDSLISECDPDGIPDNRNLGVRDSCEGDLQNGSLQSQLLQLERESNRILQDIEAEEKERQWFLTCLGKINRQLGQLSNSNGFSHQNDRPLRQQLENDAESLREAMQQKLGTRGEMQRREEARFRSICLIEKEMERLFPERDQQESCGKLFNGHLDHDMMKDKTIPDSDLQNNLSKSRSSDDETSSKMITSATQTVGMFSSESISPPPPPGGDLGSLASVYHGTWPVDKVLWHSGPSSLGGTNSLHSFHNQDTGSVASFRSSIGTSSSYRNRSHNQQLGTKVEMVYSLLSMLGSHDKDDMSRKLLNMSSSVDSCIAMRQSGCLPLLIELLHGDDKDGSLERRRPSRETRRRASQALHNIIHSHPDDKRGRREARVLRLLEQIRDYCSSLRDSDSSDEEQVSPETANADQHPVPAMAMLMKLSFDEEHRHAMCQLGGLQTIAELVQVDYETHSNMNDQYCITLRRYAGMALTNLTFGDGTNKALLCSMRPFMRALVAQLHSPSEDLRQVIASVLRNLSWRADQASKKTLREVGAVATLMKASMEAKKESTMKSILSALWNLSAHCSMNKADICAVDGALAFLVGTLTYKSPSKTHAIIENGGGILRNISSHIAVREDYRAILRQHNCLQILLQHLRSPSLTIVSNACGTLWNLSARCPEDQQTLWDMGAVGMLRNLVHSKHKMISMGSSAALKNLLSAKPGGLAAAADKHKSSAPSLLVRKQKFLEAELDQNLSETCENLDSPKTSPTHHRSEGEPKYGNVRNNHSQEAAKSCAPVIMPYQLHGRMYHSVGGQLPPKHVSRSDSKESLISTHSDSSHDRLRNLNILLQHRQAQGLGPDNAFFDAEDLSAPPGVLESRLQYVMQEVTRQIAIENNEMIKSDCGSRGISYLKSSSASPKPILSETDIASQSAKFCSSPNNNGEKTTSSSRSAIFDKYSNLTSMIENLNLDDGENTDQPVNYSLKYSEEADQCPENRKIIDEDSEARLAPKVDNRVSDDLHKDLNRNDLGQNYDKCSKQTNAEWQSSRNQPQTSFKLNANQTLYSNYAETDLDDPDQPTNYSLLYTEDTDTTDNFCPPAPQDERPYFTREYPAKGPSIHDDTMMTYCTEDTPLNFSTATSMTDLRDIKDVNSCADELQEEKCNDVVMKREDENDDSVDTNNDSKISENCSLLAEKGSDVCDKNLSHGTASPDKAVTYCVEGTPVCFSRVSSLSSIHSNDIGDNFEVSQPPDSPLIAGSLLPEPQRVASPTSRNQAQFLSGKENVDENKSNEPCNDDCDVGSKGVDDKTRPCIASARSDGRNSNALHEGKTVTFGEDHYAEETPLMFSRCSSLGSLSSFDQHSIHDDRSSVISDFSRRASEVVSPSDLPDSPGQTRSPSPHSIHAPISFTSKVPVTSTVKPRAAKSLPASKINDSTKAKPTSVFEDSSHQFAEEGTPLQFSQATSLSSLRSCYETTDKDTTGESSQIEAAEADGQVSVSSEEKQSSPDSPESAEYEKMSKHSPEGDSQEDEQEKITSADLSEGDENGDDMLEECINSAMPNNTRHSKYKHNNTKLYSRINILGGNSSRMLRSSGIPVKASNLRVGYANVSMQASNNSAMMGCAGAAMAPCKPVNQSREPCSQDLPSCEKLDNYNCRIVDSHSGPDSNSDTSSVFDDDNDKMLAQCIQSGMPKSSQSSSMSNNSVKHTNNLTDHTSDNDVKQRYHKTHFCHAHAEASAKDVEQKPPKRYQIPSCTLDTVTTFEVEGTPVNFSTATSLSDLTIDSVGEDLAGLSSKAYEELQRKKVPPCVPPYVAPCATKPSNNLSAPPPNKNLQSSYSQEDTKISKTCDIDVKSKIHLAVTSAHPNIKCCNLPNKTSGVVPDSCSQVRNSVEQHRGHHFEDDVTKTYAVEDATMLLSRGSLGSNCSHTIGDSERNNFGLQHLQDHQMRYQVEDTPVCFSRNSSLSSLSVESLGVEPTPLEQALLDECISSGMPKGRPPPDGSSERKTGKVRGSKLPCPVSCKDRQVVQGKNTPKMDSIQETGMSEVDGKLKGNEQEVEKILVNENQNISQPKNWEGAAVAACGIGTAANDTRKTDITTLDTDEKVIEVSNTAKCEYIVSEEPQLLAGYSLSNGRENELRLLVESQSCVEVAMFQQPISDFMKLQPDNSDIDGQELGPGDDLLTGALLLELEATRVAVEVQNEANRLPEEMEHSAVSQLSDLIDNINPPSVMGEVLSGSMLSSSASESLGGMRSCIRRGSSELKRSQEQMQTNKGHGLPRTRNVPELVMRALADGTAVTTKPPSVSGSLENLSMRSSMVGDLIDNVKPPSLMEDIDMTSSTYSVCSIVSEVADSKSEGLSADGSVSSDIIFKCLKPVVAMAELYARDGHMAASNRSNFSISEIIENVNPPSTFLEITDTINDCTEVGTDTLEINNDTDVEDDLPADPEPLEISQVNHEKHLGKRQLERHVFCNEANDLAGKGGIRNNKLAPNCGDDDQEGELDITPEEVLVLREDANLVLSTLNEIHFHDLAGEELLSEDMLIECETLSLVSNESDTSHSTSETPDLSGTPQGSPVIQRGPRIIKPLNRDAIKQHLQPKEEEKIAPKVIRGRRKVLYPRQQTISSFASSRFASPKPKEMAVKPTRTSALRANQSQQKVSSGGDNVANGSVGQKRMPPKSSSPLNSSGEIKVTRPLAAAGRGLQRGRTEVHVIEKNRNNKVAKAPNPDSDEEIRPNPPIKQATFTKDKPSQNSPPKISPTKTRIPTFGGGTSPVEGYKSPPQNKDDRPPRCVAALATHSKLGSSRSLDDGKAVNASSPRTSRVLVTSGQQLNKTWSRTGQNSSVVAQNVQGVNCIVKTTAIRSSPSSHSLGSPNNNGSNRRGTTFATKVNGLNGSLNATKRSSSNVSLCSNTSSSTTNSRKSAGGGTSGKKEAQSKISSLWKSNSKAAPKQSVDRESAPATPKEGLSRSSTYEKLPRFGGPNLLRRDADADMDTTSEKMADEGASSLPSSAPNSPVKKPLTKENMKVLAEARLQKWAARKARIMARKAEGSDETCQDGPKDNLDSASNSESDGVHQHSGLDGHCHSSEGNSSATTEDENTATCQDTAAESRDPLTLPSQATSNGGSSSEIKVPAAAIVPPFNYTPSNQLSGGAARVGSKSHSRSLIPTFNHVVVNPSLRQRETYVHGVEPDQMGDSKQPCLVTTV